MKLTYIMKIIFGTALILNQEPLHIYHVLPFILNLIYHELVKCPLKRRDLQTLRRDLQTLIKYFLPVILKCFFEHFHFFRLIGEPFIVKCVHQLNKFEICCKLKNWNLKQNLSYKKTLKVNYFEWAFY